MILDTETCDLQGNVYDVGYTIANKNGDIVIERNYLVSEIFTDADKMIGAFYAKKLFTHYAPMLDVGEIRLNPWIDIVAQMKSDIIEYGVNIMAAYNLGFDRRVMRQTNDLLGDGFPICPDLKQLDIWQFACETKLSQKQYATIARQNGWLSPKGNIKTGAEFAYRFVSGEFGFVEDHTALSDARIETKILAECFKQKKKIPYGIVNAAPWRLVNEKAKGWDAHTHGGVCV
jgi:DNA polymerase III epsilon subunit-like protein